MSWLFPDIQKGSNDSANVAAFFRHRSRKVGRRKQPDGVRRLIAEPPEASPVKTRGSLYTDFRTNMLISTPPDIKSRNHDAKRLNLLSQKGSLRKNMRISKSLQELHRASESRTALAVLLPTLPSSVAKSSAGSNGTSDTIENFSYQNLRNTNSPSEVVQDTAEDTMAVVRYEGSSVSRSIVHSSSSRSGSGTPHHGGSKQKSRHGEFDLDIKRLEQVEMALTGNSYHLLWKKYEEDESTRNVSKDLLEKHGSARLGEQNINASEYDRKILKQALVKGRISHPATPDGCTKSDDGISNPINAIILKNTESMLKDGRMHSYPNHVNKIEKLQLFDPFTLHERYFAATLIQKCFRRYSVMLWIERYKSETLRAERERIFKEQTHAATQIQKIYRGRAARIRFTAKLTEKFRADEYLVNFFPMLRPGSKASEREKTGRPLQLTPDEIRALYDRLVYLGKMAIQIQRIFRGTQGRIQAVGRAMDIARINLELDAATFLQSYIRQWLVYRRKSNVMMWYRHNESGTRKIFSFVLSKIVKLQAFYRYTTQQYKYRNTIIWAKHMQRISRGVATRKYIQHLHGQALIIQCAFRIYIAKEIYEELEQTAAIAEGMERVLTCMEAFIAHRYRNVRLLQSYGRSILARSFVSVKRREFHYFFEKYNECVNVELPDRAKYDKAATFSFKDKMKETANTLSSDEDDENLEVNNEQELVRAQKAPLSKAEERNLQCVQLLRIHLLELNISFVKQFHEKHNLVLGRQPLFCFSKALLEFVENPRNPENAIDTLNEGLRLDTSKNDVLIFNEIAFFAWKHDKTNQQKVLHLALCYRYFTKVLGRATKFYQMAVGIKQLPRGHPISQHCQLFQRLQDENIKSGDSFHDVIYVTKRRVDGIRLEIRVLRSGDNILISGQLWDRVKQKRLELTRLGKNDPRYAVRGIKEYRRIILSTEVKETLYRLDRPRLIRPRYGEQLARAFMPMLVLTAVKGRGQKLDIKFKQEPYPKMTIVTPEKKIYLSLVISQDDSGGLRLLAVAEDGKEYKAWFQYKEIRELFMDYPVLWYHRKVPGWRDKGDRLLQMLVAKLELHDRIKMVRRVVKDKYELSKWERQLYEEGNLTEEKKYLSLEFINVKQRKKCARENFAAMCIQAYVRGINGREKARLYKIYIMSTRLQRFWRNQRARYFLSVCMWYSRRYWAAVKIQSQIRRVLAYNNSGMYFGNLLSLNTMDFKRVVKRLQQQTTTTLLKYQRNPSSLSNVVNYVSHQIAYKQNYPLAKDVLEGFSTTTTLSSAQPLVIFLRAILHFHLNPGCRQELKDILKPTVLLDPEAESFNFFHESYFHRYTIIHSNNVLGIINNSVVNYVVYHRRSQALQDLRSVQKRLEIEKSQKFWVQVDDPDGSEFKYWWSQTTNETTELGLPCPDDINIKLVRTMSETIAEDITERRRAATKIQSCFRGLNSRDKSAMTTFKLLVRQKVLVERMTKAIEAKEKQEAQEQREAKLSQAWKRHNDKLRRNKLEPVTLVKFKRLLDCKKKGIDYNSEDYSSSDEDSSVSDVVSEVEFTSDFDAIAIEAYVNHLHFFAHDYEKAQWAYENFGHQVPLGKTLKFGSLLLQFTDVEDEGTVEKRIYELEQFTINAQMGNGFYQKFDANVLKLSIRKHRYQGKKILESRSHVFRGIFLQVVRKDYYEAHQCFRAAMALSASDRTLLCVYNVFLDRGYGAVTSPVLERRRNKIQRLAKKLEWRNKKWMEKLQKEKEEQRAGRKEKKRRKRKKDWFEIESTAPPSPTPP